jgi:hypothetical protein
MCEAMIKNILLNLLLTFSLILPVNAQNSVEDKFSVNDFLSKENVSFTEQSLVVERKDALLDIGNGLQLKAPFIDKEEYAPKQGWILSIGQLIKIQKFVEGCKNTCTILNDVIKKGYIEKLKQCQKDCEVRVNAITTENDLLKTKNKELKLNLKSEKNAKFLWAVASLISGAGLGILVYEIAR